MVRFCCSLIFSLALAWSAGCVPADVEAPAGAESDGEQPGLSPWEPELPGGGDDDDAPPEGSLSVAWAGDILLADAALGALEANGYAHPFEFVAPLLEADLAIGNAEGPITELEVQHNPDQQWHYNALPAAAQALADVGFDALSLANNHLNDRGPDGIADTLSNLDDVGVAPFGGGMDWSEALAPFLFDAPFGTVAVFGFGRSTSAVPSAGPDQPGQLLVTESNVGAAVDLADELGAAFAIAFVHWGSNYSNVSSQQRSQAQRLVDAGFDLVVGHGPHNEQGVELVDGVPVLWSLGNFTFGTPGRWDAEFPGYGLVAHTLFEGPDLDRIELRCIRTDNSVVFFQPEPCEADEAVEVLTALGDDVLVSDGVGVWEL